MGHYEEIKVHRIEKKKEEKENIPLSDSPHIFLLACLFILNKSLAILPLIPQASLPFYGKADTIEHIASLLNALQALAREDLSHQTSFALSLSELWHKLSDDCNSILSHAEDRALVVKLKFLLSSLAHFPPGEPHSLGFYLAEHAGKDWIPFPFMEILQNLHLESLAHPTDSTLAQWIHQLSDLIET